MSATEAYRVSYAAGRTATGVFAVFALLASLLCFGVATQVWQHEPAATLFLGAMGLLWFAAGGMLWASSTDAARLVSGSFDNAAGRFVLTSADGATCDIPYREIAGFNVRRGVSRSKSRSVSYTLYLLKRDGGFWDLSGWGDELRAYEALARVRGVVDLTATAAEPERAQPLPPAFKRQESNEATLFSWKNESRTVDAACSFLLGCACALLPVGVFSAMSGSPKFAAFLGACVVALVGRYGYRVSGRTFQLELSSRFLTYSTRERSERQFQTKRVLSFEEVTRLQSTFQLRQALQARSHQLTFLHDHDAQRVQNRRFDNREGASSSGSVPLDRAIIELDLPGIRTSDVLKFERHLQQELGRRGRIVA